MPDLPVSRRLLLVLVLTVLLIGAPWLRRALPGAAEGAVVDLPHQPEELVAAQPSPETVTVHVVGPVRSPGLVVLPAGSRVADAINAAGGPTGDALGPLNLARPLVDGEQLDVGAPVVAADGGQQPGAGPDPAVDRVNINTADAARLQALPGIGPAMAERIVRHRTEHGPFRSVADLQQVRGIGPAKLAELQDRATVG